MLRAFKLNGFSVLMCRCEDCEDFFACSVSQILCRRCRRPLARTGVGAKFLAMHDDAAHAFEIARVFAVEDQAAIVADPRNARLPFGNTCAVARYMIGA